jgi:hypothetical protein
VTARHLVVALVVLALLVVAAWLVERDDCHRPVGGPASDECLAINSNCCKR